MQQGGAVFYGMTRSKKNSTLDTRNPEFYARHSSLATKIINSNYGYDYDNDNRFADNDSGNREVESVDHTFQFRNQNSKIKNPR